MTLDNDLGITNYFISNKQTFIDILNFKSIIVGTKNLLPTITTFTM